MLVSLALARGDVPIAVGLTLFLPETWAGDPDRMADGPTQGIDTRGNRPLPGDEVWLARKGHGSGERKFCFSNLPAAATLKPLAATIKARWIGEQAHQQMKEELGLDDFEGRSWTGLHRPALMTMMACAFLKSRRLAAAGR